MSMCVSKEYALDVYSGRGIACVCVCVLYVSEACTFG